MQTDAKYLIFPIKLYCHWSLNKISLYDKYKTLDETIDCLSENKGYHCRIKSACSYILFGDCDNPQYTIEQVITNLISFFKDSYGIAFTEKDISYTENLSKRGSFHYSIPRYFASCDILHKIHTEINNRFPQMVDPTIYSNHWFRLPNQSKGCINATSDNIHYIVNGSMIDFIVDHIPENSINIDEICNGELSRLFKSEERSDNGEEDEGEYDYYEEGEETEYSEESDDIEDTPERRETTKALVNMLSTERSDNRMRWIEVGICLYNISKEYLSIWDEFSKRSSKYKKGECKKIWNGFRKGGLSMASLYYWAKIDNPREFNNFNRKTMDQLIEEAFSGTDTKIANLMAELISEVWIYDSTCKGWFHFDGIVWKNMGDGTSLYGEFDKLGSVLLEKKKYFEKTAKDFVDAGDSTSAEIYNGKTNKISKLITKIEGVKTMDSVVKKLSSKLRNPKFAKNLDQELHLLGLEDGIYDLKEKEFRKSTPTDMISISCGWSSKQILKVPKESTKKLKNIINKIFPDERERKYMMSLYASCLNGNSPQIFQINAGYNNQGGNGKSLMRNLMVYALGEYATEFSVCLLTQERGKSNSANPEMGKLLKVRFACCSEPENQSKINGSIVKEMTGGGKQQCRLLYSNDNSFRPQYTLFLECNRRPAIDAEDGGVTRRFRVCEFKSLFIDDESKVNPNKNIYLMDKSLGHPKKQKELGLALLKMLIDIHDELYSHDQTLEPKTPQTIKDATRRYFNDSNVFIAFLNENLRRTDDVGDYLTFQKMYREFTDSEIYNNIARNSRPSKKECFEFILKSEYFVDFHCKENNEIQAKHPINKSSNTLRCYVFDSSLL